VSDGDTLVIPKRVNTVTVVGEVYQQGTHTFASANRLEDYLSLSAGLTARADDKAIYVVKANGSVAMLESSWWRFGGASQRLSPGDTIVVPVNSQYKESLASWREITQIVYQSLISVAAVANL
jgi:polysaccharide export outer membrane protein